MYGKIGRQKMLAEIYMECGSIFGKGNTTMTDKQIIIDVCPYQGECSVSGCKRNDDGCFVKQLFEERNRAENQIVDLNKMVEAKEQECEELKAMLKDLSYENQKFCYQIEEQTKQLEPFKDEYFKSLDNVVIAGLAKKSIRITAENSKLKQTLTEIKEIAEDLITITDEYDNCYHKDECDKCLLGIDGNCQYIKVEQILQKISEVEE